VRQQSVRPAYDVDSAMARASLLRRQNRKGEAERVMAQAVAMAPGRAARMARMAASGGVPVSTRSRAAIVPVRPSPE
jgi:hypothetical protein